MEPVVSSPLLCASEASRYLRVPVRVLHKLCREGRLAFVRFQSRERFFTKEALDQCIEAHMSSTGLIEAITTHGWDSSPSAPVRPKTQELPVKKVRSKLKEWSQSSST